MTHPATPRYPLIGDNVTPRDIVSLPAYYYLGQLAGYAYGKVHRAQIERARRGEPPSKFLGTIDNLLEQAQTAFSQTFDATLQKTSPRLAVYRAFWRGASAVERLYTVEFEDAGLMYEVPIYLRRKGQEKPSDKHFSEQIDKVVTTKMSPYNDGTSEYYDPLFEFGVVKFTNGDYNKFIDQGTWTKWLVRNGLWHQQQFGKQEDHRQMTIGTGPSAQTFWVNEYSQPSGFSRFLYWFVGDQIYNLMDIPFKNVEQLVEVAVGGGQLAHSINDNLVRIEFKAISGMLRNFFRRYRYPLELDLSPEEAVVST